MPMELEMRFHRLEHRNKRQGVGTTSAGAQQESRMENHSKVEAVQSSSKLGISRSGKGILVGGR